MKSVEELEKEMDLAGMNEFQKNYAVCKAWYDTLTAEDKDIEKTVLLQHPFIIKEDSELQEDGTYYYKKGERYESSCDFVNDEEMFNEYLKLYYQECEKRGIKWQWNRTIDGDAFEMLKAAEENLLDWFEGSIDKFPEMKALRKNNADSVKLMRKHWKYRGQLIDLSMKWRSKFEKYAC